MSSLEAPEYVLTVWVHFAHRLETRPFLGVGDKRHEALEDAMRFARFHWDLGDSNMGLSTVGVIDSWSFVTDEHNLQ